MHRRLALANLADLDPPRLALRAPLHASDAAGADRGSQNEPMSHEHDAHDRAPSARDRAGADPRPDGGRGRRRRSSPARSRCSPTRATCSPTPPRSRSPSVRRRSPADRPRGRWTFGFRRLEILAAQVNGITLLVVGVVIVYAAIRRLLDPPDVRGGLVLGGRARRDRRQPRRGRAARARRAARA